MRVFAPIAGIFGLALLTGLVAYFGFASVMQAVLSSEWGTVFVVMARALALAGCGVGWWFLLMPKGPNAGVFIALRFIRESINALFPGAVVGGDVVGARLLTHFGTAMSLAIASVLIDIFVQVVSLLIYVGAGVGIVLDVPGPHRLSTVTFVMLAIALPAVAGFFLALNFGAFDPVVRWLVAFGEKRRWSMFAHVADLGDRLQQIWRNHRGLSGSFLVHLVTIFSGAVEVWIAFYFMGHPVSIAAAIAIESIGQGGKAAAFMLPGGIGVQDGTMIAAASIFGVPAEVALAMALIKRVPDLVLGIPSLLLWQALEGRRLFARRKSLSGSP
ncbi:MAG TPA: lysylphosphatidylglycerol synthase domain-containing protein [Xanthobacteraceae bacterium]|jgi:putative membrane protein|nr:lysylphosphatidylglycerol synthase domain-containing protein [Xanthobacteraceae bacterium]